MSKSHLDSENSQHSKGKIQEDNLERKIHAIWNGIDSVSALNMKCSWKLTWMTK